MLEQVIPGNPLNPLNTIAPIGAVNEREKLGLQYELTEELTKHPALAHLLEWCISKRSQNEKDILSFPIDEATAQYLRGQNLILLQVQDYFASLLSSLEAQADQEAEKEQEEIRPVTRIRRVPEGL